MKNEELDKQILHAMIKELETINFTEDEHSIIIKSFLKAYRSGTVKMKELRKLDKDFYPDLPPILATAFLCVLDILDINDCSPYSNYGYKIILFSTAIHALNLAYQLSGVEESTLTSIPLSLHEIDEVINREII